MLMSGLSSPSASSFPSSLHMLSSHGLCAGYGLADSCRSPFIASSSAQQYWFVRFVEPLRETDLCVLRFEHGCASNLCESRGQAGETFAKRQIGLVYGGGNVGLMGLIADSVLEHGGDVIGVIPRFLVHKEVAHQHLKDLRIVESMHERKA